MIEISDRNHRIILSETNNKTVIPINEETKYDKDSYCDKTNKLCRPRTNQLTGNVISVHE